MRKRSDIRTYPVDDYQIQPRPHVYDWKLTTRIFAAQNFDDPKFLCLLGIDAHDATYYRGFPRMKIDPAWIDRLRRNPG